MSEKEHCFELTEQFREHCVDLLRCICSATSNYAVLLEGPTSAGKTSIVQYLGMKAGYKCVRINNHQHTEMEEYIGTYLPDDRGKLVFREGVLV